MEEKEMRETIEFKCSNDLRITAKKDSGEIVIDEDCCTCMLVLLKNNGEMATSFLGSHNPRIIKVMEKAQKQYFKALKKTLKKMYESDEEEFSVLSEDLSEDKKWSNEDSDSNDTSDNCKQESQKENEDNLNTPKEKDSE